MKLLTITIDFLPMHGGIARYTDTLCALFGSDMSVVADLRDQTGSNDHALNRDYHVSYKAFMQDKWPRWMGAVHELGSHEVDLVLTHHVLPLGVACLMNKRRTATPYAVFLHGMDFELATRNPWKRWITKQVLKEAKYVVANTASLAERVEAFSGRSVEVVYPPAYVRPIDRIETDKLQLASVSRLVERKGVQRVLEALAKIPHLHDRIDYQIVGEGDYADTLTERIDELGLSDIASLQRNPSHEDLQHAYAKADVFVLPTITTPGDKEGFGMVYMEAAQFGIPSIASRVPGVDEAVIDNETGLLVESDNQLIDALTTMIHDTELRTKLGQSAKAHAERLNGQLKELKDRWSL